MHVYALAAMPRVAFIPLIIVFLGLGLQAKVFIVEALGALATVASAEKADATPFQMVPTIIDRFLKTEIGRAWTTVLLEVAKAYGRGYLLTRPATQRLIAANLARSDADLGRRHALALSMLLPGMARNRLGTVPAPPRDGSN
jgi:hypothetical protein